MAIPATLRANRYQPVMPRTGDAPMAHDARLGPVTLT
jgi:hypothetical protein